MTAKDSTVICGLGTGAMGSSTALAFALAGFPVRFWGRSQQSLDRGATHLRDLIKAFVDSGKLGPDQAKAVLGRIEPVPDLGQALDGADFVIESVAEDLAVKQELFARAEGLCPARAVLATNTSGLSPTALAEGLKTPERFVVAHFWNPAHLMPLVEVVPGAQTGPQAVKATRKLLLRAGKRPVVLNREAPGFVGNRLQLAVLREALHIVAAGIASKEAVDEIMRLSLGPRWSVTGPLESADLGGLDIFARIAAYLLPELDNRTEVPVLLRQAVDQGRLGAKTGAGLYDWTPKALARATRARERGLLELAGRLRED